MNQFWAHKNHEIVPDALARAPGIPVVMVGRPADYRDRRNPSMSRLLQRIATAGVSDRVFLLGEVPFADLVSLLRVAAVVLQPSRFEGWSTTVEDAKAYTRPWTVRVNYRLIPDQQLIEFVCNENEQSSKHYIK